MYANHEAGLISERLYRDQNAFDRSILSLNDLDRRSPTISLKRHHETAFPKNANIPQKLNAFSAVIANGSPSLLCHWAENDQNQNESAKKIELQTSSDRGIDPDKIQLNKREDSGWMNFVSADMLDFT